MAQRRRGLGKGIGALIPEAQQEGRERPIDVFFGAAVSRETVEDEIRDRAAESDLSSKTAAKKVAGGRSVPKKAPAKGPSAAVLKKGVDVPQGDEGDEVASGTGNTVLRQDGGVLTSSAASVDATVGGNGPVAGADVSRETPVSRETSAESSLSRTPGGIESPEAQVTDNGEDLVPVPGATYAELPVTAIVPNQKQPRSVFDEDDLNELAESIREVGVLQPVIVRPLTEPIPDHPEVRYELIMGERRWRASELAGNETVPAIVRRTADEDLLRDALLENLHRAQLNPLEEAAAYQQLLDDFGCTQEELSKRIARSRPQISNTLRLLKLPPLVQRRVAAQVLSAGHARALLGLSDGAAMERLAQRIVAESLSVRQVEEIVALGDEPSITPVARRRAKRHAAELNDLSNRLADRFDTKVKVDLGQRKGTIRIDFASIEDLNRILEVLAPDEQGLAVAEQSEAAAQA